MAELPTGTVTLLFSDMEGSTSLVKRLGTDWADVLGRHRSLLRVAIEAEDGVVVDCQGDAMFAAFRSARGAVRAARRTQEHMAREAWPQGVAVRLRMGLHTGEPDRTDDGYTGIDVVHAARLCAAGHGGQVLLTAATQLIAATETIDLGPTALPDIDRHEHVYQLAGEGLEDSFPPLRTNVPMPIEPAAEDFDARIERAEATFEQRINEQVARTIERAFELPFKKGRGKQ